MSLADYYIPETTAAGAAALPAASFLQYRTRDVSRARKLIDSIRDVHLRSATSLKADDLDPGNIAVTVRRPDYKTRGLLDPRNLVDLPKRKKGQSLKEFLTSIAKHADERYAKYLGTGSVYASGLPMRHGFGLGSRLRSYHAGMGEVGAGAVDIFDDANKPGEYALSLRPANATKQSQKDTLKYFKFMGEKADYAGRSALLEGLRSVVFPRVGRLKQLGLDKACELGSAHCGSSISRALRMHGPTSKGQLPGQVVLNPGLELNKVFYSGKKVTAEAARADMHKMLRETMRGRGRLGLLAGGGMAAGGYLAGSLLEGGGNLIDRLVRGKNPASLNQRVSDFLGTP